jgi:hypothetical protein
MTSYAMRMDGGLARGVGSTMVVEIEGNRHLREQ